MHPALTEHVRAIHVGERVRPGTRIERLPDGTTGMLLRVHEDGRGELSLAGPRSRALFKAMPPARRWVLVDFEPGAGAPFLGIAAHELVDRYARVEDVWGADGRRFRDRLVAADSLDDARRIFEDGLVQRLRLRPATASTRLARRAVARLHGDDPPARMAELAAELGVSARHLRRVFTETVGLAPKELARIARLQRVLAGSGGSVTWTERAIEAGYYDQAHLIADFRELVGTTPERYARRHAVG
ncbi:MAG: helix-turn-helix domain-containing protein [Myxococcales bacterium]|nr:helix-turn-helix domain-containing protein [Myxococcales bacterium]MCB9718864.1 helix-turn-helix domain-containing protein [Myxococcales bacterium]